MTDLPNPLSHAYLISGGGGDSRAALAGRMTAAYLCRGEHPPCGRCGPCRKAAAGTHPDVWRASPAPDKREITVDQIRALRADAYIRPNEGERKVYLLQEADRMNPPAQNAMLKLLEEGPSYAAFLLIANNAGGLLQTVRSRCEELPLHPAEEEPPIGDEERRTLVKKLAEAIGQAGELELFEAALVLDQKMGREELSALLDELEVELGARAVRPHVGPALPGGELRRVAPPVQGPAHLPLHAGGGPADGH